MCCLAEMLKAHGAVELPYSLSCSPQKSTWAEACRGHSATYGPDMPNSHVSTVQKSYTEHKWQG